jgi:hypothetical protein
MRTSINPHFSSHCFQRRGRRDKVDVAHLRIAVARHQHGIFIAFDDQRLQHQLAAGNQLIFELPQVIERGGGGTARPSKRRYQRRSAPEAAQCPAAAMRALIVAQQLTHRFKLAKEQLGGIDAHRQMRPGANHPPHVVSAAAADIKDGTSGEVGKVRQYALPFPVGTPFGIDIHAVKRPGPFTPRHQVLQQVFNPQTLAFAQRRFALGGDAMQQIQTVGRKLGQKLDGPLPFGICRAARRCQAATWAGSVSSQCDSGLLAIS